MRVRRTAFQAALLMLALSGAWPAAARAGGRITEPVPVLVDTLEEHQGLPSPHRAVRLSTAATALPIAFGVLAIPAAHSAPLVVGVGLVAGVYGGIILGPTAGYAYGGVGGRGAEGAFLRLALVTVPPALAYALVGEGGNSSTNFVPLRDRESAMVAAGVLGTLAAGVCAAYDVAAVGAHVDRRNRALIGNETTLRIEPAAAPFTHAPAVALTVRF